MAVSSLQVLAAPAKFENWQAAGPPLDLSNLSYLPYPSYDAEIP